MKFTFILFAFGLISLINYSQAQTDLCRYVVCQNGGRCSQTSSVNIQLINKF